MTAGKSSLLFEQSAQVAMRAGSVQAGNGVQVEVNKDMNRQFFTDQSLRK